MDNMYEFEEIALFLFTVLLSIIASISVWKVGPKRSEGRGKRVSIINMAMFFLLILVIFFLRRKRLVIGFVRVDIIFLFLFLLPYMLRLRFVWRVIIALMLVAINLIIVYHFPGLREYIGAQLIVCAPFLLFVKDGRPEFCGR